MSIKSKVLAAAAVLTLAGGLSAAGTAAASAATPQCANKCLTPRSAAYPGFVETALFGIPLRGVPTIVSPAAGRNPGEDFTVPTGGPVHATYFYANGMVSAAVASHYGGSGYLALQIEYAPYRQAHRPVLGYSHHRLPGRGPEPAAVQHPGHHCVDLGLQGFANTE